MSVVTAHMVYFCAFARSEIFLENARKSGVGRGQFDAVNGLNSHPLKGICISKRNTRAVHSGGAGGGQLPPPGKLFFFSNIVFD